MIKVFGSSGEVTVEIKGIAETLRIIREKGKDILNDKEAKMAQASNFLQSEIQSSIIGARLEPMSVDTGKFANSIGVDKLDKFKFIVYTDVEYAKALEYGTIYIEPRMHFRNSLSRNKQRVIDIIKSKF